MKVCIQFASIHTIPVTSVQNVLIFTNRKISTWIFPANLTLVTVFQKEKNIYRLANSYTFSGRSLPQFSRRTFHLL